MSSSKRINFNTLTISKGRNGYVKTSGVILEPFSIIENSEYVEVSIITGKGNVSSAIRIKIPMNHAKEVGVALINMSGDLLEKTYPTCGKCGADLCLGESVKREYTPKDEDVEPVIALGHYDTYGDFEPDNPVDFGGKRFDLQDNSDCCQLCGSHKINY